MLLTNTILRLWNKCSAIALFVTLFVCSANSFAQSGIKGGMETPSGFLQISLEGVSNRKNLTVNENDIVRVLPKENKHGDVNIIFFNAHVKDTLGLGYEKFKAQSNANNAFKKINDSLYEIHIHNPGKQVLFVYKKVKDVSGIGVRGAISGGLYSPNLMGERVDTLTVVDGAQVEHYSVLPFNPFLYGLELYKEDQTNKNTGQQKVTFKILFQFPQPKLMGVKTDTAIINKKSANPSLMYHDVAEFDSKKVKHIFSKGENSIFLAFKHFGGYYRSDYFDNLQYKLDDARDWVLTPLAYNPSILLSNVAPGKHRLQVRYPVEEAPVLVYDFEVLADWKDSPLWQILLFVFLTALVLILFFRIRLKRAKEKAQKSRLELQAIQAQLNPHFMFNALASIQHLVHNDKQSADLYLTEFSNLLRHSLYNNEKEMVPLSVELQTLDSYIRLEKLRFHFQYEQYLDKNIETDTVNIPGLLIQPLIENAIKHGVAPLQQSGFLQVHISQREEDLEIKITDNGKGFKNQPPDTGLGLKLVRERIKVLKSQGFDIRLSFQDNQINKTTVTIIFKDWL